MSQQKFELGGQDISARIAAMRHSRNIWLYRLFAGWLGFWHRRYLASLSDRQIKDAGIDPARAGRGKASAARLDPNLEGLR